MAAPASGRSRSVRSEGPSMARHQTGALHVAGVDYGRLITERGRQDHAGQHNQSITVSTSRYRIWTRTRAAHQLARSLTGTSDKDPVWPEHERDETAREMAVGKSPT